MIVGRVVGLNENVTESSVLGIDMMLEEDQVSLLIPRCREHHWKLPSKRIYSRTDN